MQGHVVSLVSSPEIAQAGAPDTAASSEALFPGVDARVQLAVEHHVDLVWRVLRRAGLGTADAEDASQEVFWVFAQRLGDVPASAERAFLVSSALRVASSLRRSRWCRSVGALEGDTRVSEAPLPDEVLERRREREFLKRALDELDEGERQVFVLAELEQLSRSEVARALDLPEGTVASRLRHARRVVATHVRRQESGLWRRP